MVRARRELWIILGIATLMACGGDGDGGGGVATLTGQLQLPPSNQCPGCSTDTRPITASTLNKDAAPTTVVPNAVTDSQGNFNIANPALENRTVIVVASMSQAASMGGVDAVTAGLNAKNFNVTTQIACLAAVLITRGDTAGSGTVCGNPAFVTLDPSLVNDTRIANLEAAAAEVQAQVDLSTGQVGAAACAVINCTNEGAEPSPAGCMATAFP
ncbi:MAG: hypothetical protein ACREQ9_10125 [Candidatus Binatia bacterium]